MSTVSIVDLRKTPQGSLVSLPVQEKIEEITSSGGRVLIYHNRRGEGSVFSCESCSHISLCPKCDVPVRVHTTPSRKLLCHQCNHVESCEEKCPKCPKGVRSSRGIRIQNISNYISRVFPKTSLVRVDTDNSKIDFSDIESANIVLATSQIFSYPVSSFDLVVCVLFESDISISHYEIEEDIIRTYRYLLNLCDTLYVQTFLPDLPLLNSCISRTYIENISSLLAQRKTFQYPPYGDMVTIRVEDFAKKKLSEKLLHLVSKLHHSNSGEYLTPDDLLRPEVRLQANKITIWYDRDIFTKFAGKWQQKIIVKGPNLHALLSEAGTELFRNSGIYIER